MKAKQSKNPAPPADLPESRRRRQSSLRQTIDRLAGRDPNPENLPAVPAKRMIRVGTVVREVMAGETGPTGPRGSWQPEDTLIYPSPLDGEPGLTTWKRYQDAIALGVESGLLDDDSRSAIAELMDSRFAFLRRTWFALGEREEVLEQIRNGSTGRFTRAALPLILEVLRDMLAVFERAEGVLDLTPPGTAKLDVERFRKSWTYRNPLTGRTTRRA